MRKTLIAATIFTGLALAVVSVHSPNSAAMNGGTLLTTRQGRAGIFQIFTYDGAANRGACTATVLSSSVAANRSWLVTAAHCFSYIDDLYYVYGHFTNPRVSVIYDRNGDGAIEDGTPRSDSTVWVWPEWLVHSGHTAWFGVRDVAVIRVNQAIPIYGEDGVRIQEFRRPIYVGPASQVSEPYVSTSMKTFSKNAFCGQGRSVLRCDTLSNLWWSPNFRNQFFQLPFGAWENNGFYEAGDSGGPLLKYVPGLARKWDGAGGVIDIAMYGAVLGVLQGPTVFCDYGRNGNCNPGDGLATRFEGLGGWFLGLAGLAVPQISSWITFANQFEAGTGETNTTLTAVADNSYTFPAYAGNIVGVGINKSTNQVHTWYDNGVMTIGTRSDLDFYSQASGPAPIPDLMPTRYFSGVPGKLPSQIVAMMIDPNGNVFTWYDDGTEAMGSVTDLDFVHGPQTYTLPPGKTPRDIVGIAARPAGGVLAYYRDGTVSAGLFFDLDLFAPPTPFQTGNGRGPQDILDIDTYSDGRTLTLFMHPTF